jgi:hypothetical protein
VVLQVQQQSNNLTRCAKVSGSQYGFSISQGTGLKKKGFSVKPGPSWVLVGLSVLFWPICRARTVLSPSFTLNQKRGQIWPEQNRVRYEKVKIRRIPLFFSYYFFNNSFAKFTVNDCKSNPCSSNSLASCCSFSRSAHV